MISRICISMMLVFCACKQIQAQKTYLWVVDGSDAFAGDTLDDRRYRLIDFDLETGEDSVLLEFRHDDFPGHIPVRNVVINDYYIATFAFDRTKEHIYFLANHGHFYRYHIASKEMYAYGDLLDPDDPFDYSDPDDYVIEFSNIKYINDSLYYLTGYTNMIYNINTEEGQILDQRVSLADANSPQGVARRIHEFINDSICMNYIGDYYRMGDYYTFDDYELLWKNPIRDRNAKPFIDYDSCGNQQVFMLIDAFQYGGIGLFRIDLEEHGKRELVRLYDSIGGLADLGRNFGNLIADIHHEPRELSPREVSIDLDALDRTRAGLDYKGPLNCLEGVALGDSIDFGSSCRIDSIQLSCEGCESGHFEIPEGNYRVACSEGSCRILSYGHTSLADLRGALSEGRFHGQGMRIAVVPWRGGISGDTAYVLLDSFRVRRDTLARTRCGSAGVVWGDSVYTELGYHGGVDTVYTQAGCDSIIYSLEIKERERVALVDSLNICGERASVNYVLPSEFAGEDIRINGEAVANESVRIEEGENVLTYRQGDCALVDTIIGVRKGLPDIRVEDIIDQVYESGYALRIEVDASVEDLVYEWYGGIYDCDDCENPRIIEKKSGLYAVRVEDGYGCEALDSFEISWIENEFYIPNVVSRDAKERENQYLHLISAGEISYDVEVYDRWGNRLFGREGARSNKPEEGWRPREGINKGVYVYQIRFELEGKAYQLEGTAMVLD